MSTPYLLTGRQETNLLRKEVGINQVIHTTKTGQCLSVFHRLTYTLVSSQMYPVFKCKCSLTFTSKGKAQVSPFFTSQHWPKGCLLAALMGHTGWGLQTDAAVTSLSCLLLHAAFSMLTVSTHRWEIFPIFPPAYPSAEAGARAKLCRPRRLGSPGTHTAFPQPKRNVFLHRATCQNHRSPFTSPW